MCSGAPWITGSARPRKRTLTLSLTRKIRAALTKGETVTLSVVAIDAAKNKSKTTTATAKVP